MSQPVDGEGRAADVEAPPRLGTGSAGLDTVLNGGFPANRLYLVEGDPGTGKTTLALQFLLEGARLGEPVLYVTLSETREELMEVARSHGWSLAGVTLHELVPPEESLKAEAQYTIFHPSEVELGETTRLVIEEVERIEPRRVVFDSLSEMRLLARDPLRYRRQILALKQFFAGRRSTVLLLDDRTSTNADLQVQSIAHGVLMLEQLELDYGAERRRLRVSKLRGSRFRGGFHDFAIRTGGIEVFPRLVASGRRSEEFKFEPVQSGVTELDALLGGGLDRGTSTLVLGPAGCGKSSLATHFAAAAAERGERAAAFIFDEGVNTYLSRAAGLGTDLRAQVEAGHLTVQQVDPAELSPGEFVHAVCQAVERDGARLVVIDSLNGYLQAMPDERFLTSQMHELLTYLNQQGVVTLIVMAQHGFMGSMSSPVDVSYLADTVVLLRYFEAAGAIRRAISVVKKRTGHHEDTIREMRLSASRGVEVGEPLTGFRGVLTGVPVLTEDVVKKSVLLGSDDDED